MPVTPTPFSRADARNLSWRKSEHCFYRTVYGHFVTNSLRYNLNEILAYSMGTGAPALWAKVDFCKGSLPDLVIPHIVK